MAAVEPSDPREFYYYLLAAADQLEHPRREWQTPKEHQNTLQEVLPIAPVAHIVDRFQSVHYGQYEADEAEVDRLRRDWAAINEFLWEQGQRQ